VLACIAPRQKAIKKTHSEEKTEERTKTPHSEKKKPRKSGTGGKRCVLASACYCRLPGHRAESIEEIETKGDANRKPQTRAGWGWGAGLLAAADGGVVVVKALWAASAQA
jgi:hypothetical protein